jgi:nitroreductase
MKSIFTRRSIRSFTNESVSKETMEEIIRAGMQSPSAMNKQPWEFIVTNKKEDKNAIAVASQYASCVKNADYAIVVLSNHKKDNREDYWWVQDLSAATQNILLAITEASLAGVWLGFYPNEKRVNALKEHFDLDEKLVPFSVIAVGHSDKENVMIDRYDASKVCWRER